MRTGYSMLEGMGEHGARSTLAGCLADVLSLARDDFEAERFAEIARDTAAEADVMPQVLWRRALARTAARRGHTAVAEELARDAVTLAGGTDSLDLRAGTLVALGEVLRDAGQTADASASLVEARALYVLKGNVAAMQIATSTRESAA